jgi:hypothetical protein
MISRGHEICLHAHLIPAPSRLPLVSSIGETHYDLERQLAAGRRREGGGRGSVSYDCKKAWSYINIQSSLVLHM